MASVDIGAVRSEGCDLEFLAGFQNDYDSKLRADSHGSRKDSLHLFRTRACGDVDVVSPLSEQHIPDAAACKKGLVSGQTQALDDPRGGDFHPAATLMPPRPDGRHHGLRGTGETRQHPRAAHR